MARQTGTRLSTSVDFRAAAGRAEGQAARLTRRAMAAGTSPAARASLLRRANAATSRADKYHVKASKLRGGRRDTESGTRQLRNVMGRLADGAASQVRGGQGAAIRAGLASLTARGSNGIRVSPAAGTAVVAGAPRAASPAGAKKRPS